VFHKAQVSKPIDIVGTSVGTIVMRETAVCNRRAIIAGIYALAGVTAFPSSMSRAQAARPASQTLSSPLKRSKRLKPGDVIGLIAPSGATYEADDRALIDETVRALGFVPRHGTHNMDRYGYLAGRDEDRAADINTMFRDPEVKALLAVRGGWGAARMLRYLDYDAIAANPKPVMGFSDITGLHLALQARAGIISFHGTNAASGWGPASVQSFNGLLVNGETPTWRNPIATEDRLVQRRWRTVTIKSGIARGRLIGGNLTVLSTLVGTPYMPDMRGAILMLEDTNEAEYRIDRMLTQLSLAGILGKISGFIFGQCTDCTAPASGYGNFALSELLQQHIAPLNIPAFQGAYFGHIANQPFIPMGAQAELDADKGTFRLLEPAVI
jgi:muramoyltetrapeptide carboxypeptidase